jgi:4-hydroxyproline epimerase
MQLRAHQPQQMIRVIDSHTGGEPTRVVVEGLPDLGTGEMSSRRELLRDEFDWLRRSLLSEPRGADWMVGAVLLEPVDPTADAGVVFFNNVGYLGMCGHGLIGLVATLEYIGRTLTKEIKIETPVGPVLAKSLSGGRIAISNVPSYRLRKDLAVETPGYGTIVGDVAWGGNWFFLAQLDEMAMRGSVDELTRLASQTRVALYEAGVVGENGAEIDHVEFFGEPSDASRADSRSFVLCPGGQYDRSPCGTGTSAKLACLAADGSLAPGEIWRQESFIGSIFEARYEPTEKSGAVAPTIIGQAFVTGDLHLVIDPDDPFGLGIPSPDLVSGV